MAILVHDGSVASEYNSYASFEAADEFHEDRRNTVWTDADDSDCEAALIRATDYIDHTYSFPAPDGEVHPLLVRATIVLAALALVNDLSAKAERGIIEIEEELTGVSKERVKYDTASIADPYPMITRILAPLTGNTVTGATMTIGQIIR